MAAGCLLVLLAGELAGRPRAGAASGAEVPPTPLPSLASPVAAPPPEVGVDGLAGWLSAPGGPFLVDAEGRVVFLHGVNAVDKRAPFELEVTPGEPFSFTAQDASLIARLGFDLVRLGISWAGLEPGTAPANDPAICRHGPPGNPHQFDPAVLDAYLARVAQVVDLLGRYHVYTLLDMHQDVYSPLFHGDGAPDWAVCTDGIAPSDPPGRWSANYATPAADAAYENFWTNDVVGDLQGQFDQVWQDVAGYFRSNPWVVGYDPVNEPFSRSVVQVDGRAVADQLACFYLGRQGITVLGAEASAITCPRFDPELGVIPRILASAPNQLVFYEPDIFELPGQLNEIGPIDLPRLVYNVHVYCPERNPVTGNPTDLAACVATEDQVLRIRLAQRADLGTPAQPGGPPLFVSEFGATSSVPLLEALTAAEDRALVGWAYWSWRFYRDPTGSTAEALLRHDGTLKPTARVLAETYPQAVAGWPRVVRFDPATGSFELSYVPNPAVDAPTVLYVSPYAQDGGEVCPRVLGGRVAPSPLPDHLLVWNDPGARLVRVVLSPANCLATSPSPEVGPGSSVTTSASSTLGTEARPSVAADPDARAQPPSHPGSLRRGSWALGCQLPGRAGLGRSGPEPALGLRAVLWCPALVPSVRPSSRTSTA